MTYFWLLSNAKNLGGGGGTVTLTLVYWVLVRNHNHIKIKNKIKHWYDTAFVQYTSMNSRKRTFWCSTAFVLHVNSRKKIINDMIPLLFCMLIAVEKHRYDTAFVLHVNSRKRKHWYDTAFVLHVNSRKRKHWYKCIARSNVCASLRFAESRVRGLRERGGG